MGSHQEETNRFGIVLFQHLANGEKVTQAFGHFLVVDVDKTVVHPVFGHRLAESAFALGDFIFMVRELQVCTARMNVKTLAQQCTSHGGALNMPAGAARAKSCGPFGIVRLRGLG